MRHTRAPRDWSKIALENVAHVQTGVSKSASRTLRQPITVPYLRVANVQDGFIDLSEIKEIQIERESLERYAVLSGDVLLTEGGDFDKLGRGCVWRGQIESCIHQNHVFVVRPKNGKLLAEFLSGQAGCRYGRAYFLACSKQTTNLASINSTQLKQYPVLLPPFPEQRRIVAVLSAWDRGIEAMERLVALKTRRKRALMQQLLTGKRRFPEFVKSTRIRSTRFGKAPTDWPMRPFGDFMTESRVSGSHGRDARKITVKLYGKGVIAKDEKRLGSESTQYYRRSAGQFIYSKLDFLNGAFGIIPDDLDGFESTLDLPALEVAEGLDKTFLLSFVTRPVFYTRCIGFAMGGRKARRVPPEQFLSIEFPCPCIEEQQRIAAVLRACDDEIDHLTAQLDALRQQKKGLMQKLLTGEVRVPEAKEN